MIYITYAHCNIKRVICKAFANSRQTRQQKHTHTHRLSYTHTYTHTHREREREREGEGEGGREREIERESITYKGGGNDLRRNRVKGDALHV